MVVKLTNTNKKIIETKYEYFNQGRTQSLPQGVLTVGVRRAPKNFSTPWSVFSTPWISPQGVLKFFGALRHDNLAPSGWTQIKRLPSLPSGSYFVNGSANTALPPPPLSFVAVGIFSTNYKKTSPIFFFFFS